MAVFPRSPAPVAAVGAEDSSSPDSGERSSTSGQAIGDILRVAHNLSTEDIEQILRYQREKGLRFGEAAVALGFVKEQDVRWAVSKQFRYPYILNKASALSFDMVVARDPFSVQAQVFRDIRSQLVMGVLADGPSRILSIVSPERGDGRSFFAVNLATVFSQLGARTLLVDGDLRNPALHRSFGLEPTKEGLSSFLSSRSGLTVIRPVEDLPNLHLLPVGTPPPNPQELAEGALLQELFDELPKRYEYVIVDTSAAAFGADSCVIAARCDAALVVTRRNRNPYSAVQRLVERLGRSPVRVAGVAINEY